MVNQRNWGIGLGLAAVVLGGCAVQDRGEVSEVALDPAERPQVVATSGVLCDLARQIAEDTITLTCLLAPGQDPHTYQARPSDRQAVDTADLVLYEGYDFAPSVLNVVVSSRNPAPKVAVLEAAVPNPLMGQGHDHDHSHDHDHEHEANEHIWFDFALTLDAANHIVEAIVELRPEAKESTTKSLSVFEDELGDLEGRVESLREDALGLGFIATEGVANLMLLNAGFQNLTPDALSDAVEEERDVPLDALEEAKALLENKVAAILVVNITTTDVATDQLIAAAESGNRQVVRVSEAASGANSNEVDDYLSWMNHVIDQLMQAIE